MRKWIVACFVAGFIGAAVFYSPYVGVNLHTEYACPACIHYSTINTNRFFSFVRFVIVGGALNAMLFSFLGFIAAKGLEKIKQAFPSGPDS
jgi:hypothetical protein